MQQFKENIKCFFGENHLFKLNVDYLYDTIGEDLNDLCESFSKWVYQEEELVRIAPFGVYLNNKSNLNKKLLSFNKKLLEKIPCVHHYSIRLIIQYLMSIISNMCGNGVIFLGCRSRLNKHHYAKNIFQRKYVNCEYISMCKLDLVIDVWTELKRTYDIEVLHNYYDLVSISSIAHFISLDNEKLCEHLLKFWFLNDCICLNIEFLQEELMKNFDAHLIKIKEKIKHFDLTTSNISYRVSDDEPYYTLNILSVYNDCSILDASVGKFFFFAWICIIVSKCLKVPIHSNYYNNYHCSYKNKCFVID